MRPIDADALKSQFLKNYNTLTNIIREQNTNSAIIGVSEFIGNTINSVPTADVQEVKQGKWIKQNVSFDLCGVEYYHCSLCDKSSQIETPFCQWCGAKMDGVNATTNIYNCEACKKLCCDGCELYEGTNMDSQ